MPRSNSLQSHIPTPTPSFQVHAYINLNALAKSSVSYQQPHSGIGFSDQDCLGLVLWWLDTKYGLTVRGVSTSCQGLGLRLGLGLFLYSIFFYLFIYCGIFKALRQTRHRPYMRFVSTSYRDGRRSTLRWFEYGGEKKHLLFYFILFFNFLPEYSLVVISLSFSLRQVINNMFSMRWLIYSILFYFFNKL